MVQARRYFLFNHMSLFVCWLTLVLTHRSAHSWKDLRPSAPAGHNNPRSLSWRNLNFHAKKWNGAFSLCCLCSSSAKRWNWNCIKTAVISMFKRNNFLAWACRNGFGFRTGVYNWSRLWLLYPSSAMKKNTLNKLLEFSFGHIALVNNVTTGIKQQLLVLCGIKPGSAYTKWRTRLNIWKKYLKK